MTGVTVTFTVTLGGGSLSTPGGPTNGSGLTTIQWTLGTTPGQQQLVQASLAGTSVSPATFSATATAGPPVSATKLVGDSQTAATNNSVSTPPAVAARSEEHTSELQSRLHLVCRLLLEKK